MKLSGKIAFGLTVITAAVIVVYVTKSDRAKRMLNQIADEGYETAHDILFPGKKISTKKLQYGPVIPS